MQFREKASKREQMVESKGQKSARVMNDRLSPPSPMSKMRMPRLECRSSQPSHCFRRWHLNFALLGQHVLSLYVDTHIRIVRQMMAISNVRFEAKTGDRLTAELRGGPRTVDVLLSPPFIDALFGVVEADPCADNKTSPAENLGGSMTEMILHNWRGA